MPSSLSSRPSPTATRSRTRDLQSSFLRSRAARIFAWTCLALSDSRLEPIVNLREPQRPIRIDGVNFLDHVAALRIPKVQPKRKTVLPLIVPADVIERRQRTPP